MIVNKQEVLLIREVGQSDVAQAVVPETSASPRSNEYGVSQASNILQVTDMWCVGILWAHAS
jgi:hypothetical protein